MTSDVRGLRPDLGNRWWKFTPRILETGVERFRGGAIPSIGAFGDTVALLRGTDRLLFDVVERPEQVAAADLFQMDLWCQVYDRFHAVSVHADPGFMVGGPAYEGGDPGGNRRIRLRGFEALSKNSAYPFSYVPILVSQGNS